MSDDIFPGLDLHRAHRALREIEASGRDALAFFEAGNFGASATELIRIRRAIRTLDDIRREQKREALTEERKQRER